MHRRGATACFLCGQSFSTVRPEIGTDGSQSPLPLTSSEPVKPYSPPSTLVSRVLSFRISSFLLVISVVAVCLAGLRKDVVVGTVLALAAAPALIYTIAVAAVRTARGRPMALLEKLRTLLAAIIGVLLITFCAVAASCMTYLSVGRATANSGEVGSIIALAAGGLAGVVGGAFAVYVLFFMKSQRTQESENR